MIGGSAHSCATRYPLLLLHGVAVRDGEKDRIWGRIPQMLREHGAEVYVGWHDGWGTPVSNALQLSKRLGAIIVQSGACKVNIIAHSKGGVDARYLIAMLSGECAESTLPQDDEAGDSAVAPGISETSHNACSPLPIASLTTIATPHHGSLALEKLLTTFRPFFAPAAFVINHLYRRLGDAAPDLISSCEYLTTTYMQAFNTLQPSLPQIYSQQFASSLHGPLDDLISIGTYPFIACLDGPNDGLVTFRSAAFDNFRGELSTAAGRGVAHVMQVDATRRPFSRRKPPGTSRPQQAEYSDETKRIPLRYGDIVDFYLALAADLKARGY